jgi:hypothetical protein
MQLVKYHPKNQISHDAKFEISDKQIHCAYNEALAAGGQFAVKAIICGQMLSEKKAFVGHGNWGKWLEQNFQEKHRATVCRWMNAADRVTQALGINEGQWQIGEGQVIDVESQTLSSILTLPEAELDTNAQKARQLFLDFTSDKTIADCLRDVADGTSPDHRIARAANGKNKGGHKGEDRKAWDEFTQKRLSQVNEHLSHWESYSAGQKDKVLGYFETAVSKWPAPLLEHLREQIKEELKSR